LAALGLGFDLGVGVGGTLAFFASFLGSSFVVAFLLRFLAAGKPSLAFEPPVSVSPSSEIT
jgi:hypothetical protein